MKKEAETLKKELEAIFADIEKEVVSIFDETKVLSQKYEGTVEEQLADFRTKTKEVMTPAKSNGTKMTEENLELQKTSWVDYTEKYMDELEKIEDIITDNATALRVEQSYLYSINETEYLIAVKDEFVDKLRTLLVYIWTLILFLLDMALLVALAGALCTKAVLTNKEAYRRIYPKRYVPAKGPNRNYYWPRRN